MQTRLSSRGNAQSPKYGRNMVRIMFTNRWIGVGLTILCLGTSGGCCCRPDKVGKPPLPSALCIDRLPRGPNLCGPCAGYHPTCWMAWSDCYTPCPPPEQVVPIPHGRAGDILPGEGVRSPDKDLEAVPMPQEESRPKVGKPPKAEEPLPKLERPPKAPPPLNKAKEPQPIVPAKPPMDDSRSHESDSANWEVAPLPEQYVKSPAPDKMAVHTAPIPKYSLRILDSDSSGGKSAPTRDVPLAVLVPEKRDVFPEILQVVFRQEERDSSDGQQDKQPDGSHKQPPSPACSLVELNHAAGHAQR